MITIDVRKSNKCNGDYSMFISFPYDNRIVEVIRSLPSKYWYPDTKEWEVPLIKLEELTKKLSAFDIQITGQYVVLEKPKAKVPANFHFKTEPFSHQIDGLNYGLQNDRWLLGDEQGLGKTKQVIDIAVAKKLEKGYKHCLIVCGVNSLKWNWKREIETHSDEQAFILGERVRCGKVRIGSNKDKLADVKALASSGRSGNTQAARTGYFIITNVETLRDDEISSEIAKLCEAKIINMIALDECHKCLDYNSKIITNYGIMRLGDIVKTKAKVSVLSYNEAAKVYEFKPVVDWHENHVETKLLHLRFRTDDGNITSIDCTPDHKIFTRNRGYVEAQDLTDSDDVMC